MPPSATPTTDDAAAAAPFGGGIRLAAEDKDAISRALVYTVVPLGTAWTELLGHGVEVQIGEISPGPVPRSPDLEPDPTASILDSVAEPGSFISVGLLGGDLGTAALVIPTALGLAVVDLLLGGSGRPPGERTLSAIDVDLLRSVVPPTLGALRHLGPDDRVGEPVPLLEDLEEADLSARLASGISVAVSLTIGEQQLTFTLVLSANAARHLTGAATVTAAETPTEQSRAAIQSVLADVQLEAVVRFPPVRVPSHRVLALDVGDVIPLGTPPDHPLPLTVGGLHVADVRPARVGNDVACQVVTTTVGEHADRFVDPHTGGLL